MREGCNWRYAIIGVCAVSIRLKSVKNIQKITKSMKMVAAAKYARAERELRPARTFGQGSLGECSVLLFARTPLEGSPHSSV